VAVAAGVAAALVGGALVPPVASEAASGPASRHVLLVSVDGMHQSDLRWYVAHHPRSALAGLVHRGTEFTRARTPFPSDSFPGMVGQLTGGNPKTTGIYYDVTYNHALIDPSASSAATPSAAVCASHARGANVPFDESIDRDNTRLDAGQGLANLPRNIMRMTGHPQRLINPALLPINPKTCRRVYPHSYLKVNTVFDVVKRHGLRTAWADKHPAYEILNGPSGRGLDDLFTPEINSIADKAGDDWTQVNSLTQRYDHFKVRAVLNEIHGLDHSGRHQVGMPGAFGMNFQSVSTAEKLPTSGGQPGGYNATGTTPGPVLRSALNYVNGEVGSMVTALKRTHHYRDTTIILSAKHAQSPMARRSLKRIDDGAVIDSLNKAWKAQHPAQRQPLVAASLDDDGMLLWFTPGDRTALADRFASRFLSRYAGTGTGVDGQAKSTNVQGAPVPYTQAGLTRTYAGAAAARFMGTRTSDPRLPDLIGITQHGVVYTGKTSKIAEHGGDHSEDRHVPLVVAGPGVVHAVRTGRVETTQVAPTILALLGLRPGALDAVRIEHTHTLRVH
jgi:hypothetical protein